MKKVFEVFVGALAALLLSSAAVATPTVAKDGYYFEHGTHPPSSQIWIEIVRVNSYKDINRLWKEKGGYTAPKGKEVKAFSLWSEDGKTCTIYMLDPEIDYEPQYYGHELTHCMYGEFHKSQP